MTLIAYDATPRTVWRSIFMPRPCRKTYCPFARLKSFARPEHCTSYWKWLNIVKWANWTFLKFQVCLFSLSFLLPDEAIQARAHDGSHTSNRRMNVLISGRRIHRMVACAPKESNRIRKGRGAWIETNSGGAGERGHLGKIITVVRLSSLVMVGILLPQIGREHLPLLHSPQTARTDGTHASDARGDEENRKKKEKVARGLMPYHSMARSHARSTRVSARGRRGLPWLGGSSAAAWSWRRRTTGGRRRRLVGWRSTQWRICTPPDRIGIQIEKGRG